MNLQHLKYFDVLAREEHYTRSSKLLNITQPSLSNAISLLEDELGVQLFEKNGRNVALTKPGKIFHEHVIRTLENLDSGIDTVTKISKGFGHISFAFLQVLGTSYVPKVTKQFLEANPEKKIQFEFHSDSVSTETVQGLKTLRYDLGICSYIINEPTIEFVPIASQELVVITALNHPLAQFDEVSLEDLAEYPQIIFSKKSALREIIDDLYQRNNVSYQVAYEVKIDQVIAGLVSQNLGIAIIPNMTMLDSLPLKRIKLKDIGWERYFYLAYNKETYLPPVVSNFKDFILAHADPKQIVY
ncbi:LysR family transcriptional regulator [Enterococcus casseliflavus]|uniref:LysR family transcriptional regulator n=1 Tax=Enterococcus casseliflavus TaxID=37734 RepID=UPI0003F73042|nr:LysR family transcriptional regulator [Enterococcus casseliflavus]MBN2903626.1 LysR family transcriptional regulator [Enterococcus sp.]NKD36815.1 LysR family transcriptional regulator [Enterococcus casseliflavus]SFD67928.1 transcriptional regulator, LysR family [Enterococcus casseliflavus]STP36908.1 LysR family transcriptional regulator [Enterococcus casseliflavus]GEB28960.1 LysR family transcriptional regulator [Enterococcus casseliflavus]